MNRVVIKPAFRICENEGADQLGGDHEADQKSNRKAMNRNWSNQKANPALKTKAGNK